MSKTKRHRQSRSKRRKQQLDTTKAEDDSLSETDLERAISFHQAGELDLASQIYHAIIAADSRNADAHHLLGVITNQLGDNKTAINLINRAIDLNPAQSSFYNNLGKILKEEGQLDQAIAACQQSVKIDPQNGDAYYNLGLALQDQGRLDQAIQAYQAAVEINPRDVIAYNNLGNILREQERPEEAIQAYHLAIGIDEGYTEAYYNLGNLLRELGRLREAIQVYHNILLIDPDNVGTYFMLAKTKQHVDYDDKIQAMENLLEDSDTNDEKKTHLNFALGKAYEDLQMYDKAFEFFLDGNRIKRSTLEYNISEDQTLSKKLVTTFDDQLFNRCTRYGFDDDTPIFILGMPRSGTSLVEQILSSHGNVYGAGELHDLTSVLFESNPKLEYDTFPDHIMELSSHDFSQFGASYVGRLRQRFNHVRYITNKMPSNFLYIGMIKLILPQAKIIHCQRHPLDTCLSCFKTCFTSGQSFSYQLTELGRYYGVYEELMSHWSQVLPDYILHFQYEDLIADQENQIRRLLDFCCLEWDASCLSFHQNNRLVKTASATQVRRPLYSSSVGLWKKYENQLQPLISILTATE